ncbi:MAG: hypothetical protein AB7V32_08270 [Candidatus Berkiella sp.]
MHHFPSERKKKRRHSEIIGKVPYSTIEFGNEKFIVLKSGGI